MEYLLPNILVTETFFISQESANCKHRSGRVGLQTVVQEKTCCDFIVLLGMTVLTPWRFHPQEAFFGQNYTSGKNQEPVFPKAFTGKRDTAKRVHSSIQDN